EQPEPASVGGPDGVDAGRIQRAVLRVVDLGAAIDGPFQPSIRRRMVHAYVEIRRREDTGNMAAGRHEPRQVGRADKWIDDAYPGEVQRGEPRVEARPPVEHVSDAGGGLLRSFEGRVEDREPISLPLALQHHL